MTLAMTGGAESGAAVLLALAVILTGARLGAWIFERARQPGVLGELLFGVALGSLHLVGFSGLEFLRDEESLLVIAEIGIVLLLFEIGAETTLPQMLQVGRSAVLVAIVGILAPAALGFAAASRFFPSESTYSHLFVGAILCATSVGITARVLRDSGRQATPEAKIVLGAAVIDDVLGLVALAVVSALIAAADAGRALLVAEVAWIAGKAILFVVGAAAVGGWIARGAFRAASAAGGGFLLATSLGLCFAASYAAHLAGLAPIIGAFVAGVTLRNDHFLRVERRTGKTLSEHLHPILSLLLPVFFVSMGLQVRVEAFGEPGVLVFAAVLSVAAIVGKLACGACVARGHADRLAVGIGMMPRGEVGLIFAGVGATLTLAGEPVVTPAIFSAAIIMVLVTTLLTPPLLNWRMRGRTSGDDPAPLGAVRAEGSTPST